MATCFPYFRQVVLDCVDTRELAEFYRRLLGYEYRPGDAEEDPGGDDWLVISSPEGANIAFQQVDRLSRPTWPEGPVDQQLHLDFTVSTAEELLECHERVLGLGGEMLLDLFDDEEERLRVYSDPAGHPFCIFVAS